MGLKVVKKTPEKKVATDEKRVAELEKEIADISSNIKGLFELRTKKKEELLSIKIAPYKIGGYALAEVPSGKTIKEQKCLLECVEGELYLRPVKDNVELSGRHFICTDYKSLKEVD